MMKKYSEYSKCQKCRGDYIRTKYKDAGFRSNTIERTCLRCGYIWYEKPHDNEEKDDG